MKIVEYKTEDIIAAEYNPRQLTKDQYSQLKDSLKRFGLVDPLIINKHKERKNILVGGHQRLKIAKELGMKKIPCVQVDLTLDEEKELNIRLNKNVGEWDYDSLANYFDVDDLMDWGFADNELQFYEDEQEQGLIEDDEIPEVEEAITKQGDLWILGEHRLLCGDATKKEDVDLLMDGNKADMVFTDPPYGIGFQSNYRKKTPQFRKIKNDNVVLNISESLVNLIKKDSVVYLCTRWDLYPQWYGQISSILDIKNCIVWYKKGGGLGDLKNTYLPNHEFIIVGHNGKAELRLKRKADVWEICRDGFNDYKHPTQKPVELSQFAILHHSNDADTVIDLFLGSGSTLIACEKTNRKCYGMEIDPHYCDVIVKRWEDFTGKKAILNKGVESNHDKIEANSLTSLPHLY